MNFSYDDFLKKLNSSGLGASFSDADMALARNNPDAGMGILSAKLDYSGATTPEARALANQRAEELRRLYGNYTAGTDGSGFYPDGLSPGSFSSSYVNRYENDIADLWDRVKNRGDFTWSAETDPAYQAYAKEYAREGQRASADTLASIAAQNGGQTSSYAATAAAQAGNYYAAQMADRVPELYDAAYQRYLNDAALDRQTLSDALALEQSDYSKYLDSRNFGYQQLLDTISNQRQNRYDALNEAAAARELGDLSKYEALGFDTSNDTTVEMLREALNAAKLQNQATEDENARAWNADSRAARAAALEEAVTRAQTFGDVSGLVSLGFDVSNYTGVEAAQTELELLKQQLRLNEAADARAERQLQDSLASSEQSRSLAALNAAMSLSSASSGDASSDVELTDDVAGSMYERAAEYLENSGVSADILDSGDSSDGTEPFLDYISWQANRLSGIYPMAAAVDSYDMYVKAYIAAMLGDYSGSSAAATPAEATKKNAQNRKAAEANKSRGAGGSL